jgi:hypothetical protein
MRWTVTPGLVAVKERQPEMRWTVTPGLNHECDSNREARKPR